MPPWMRTLLLLRLKEQKEQEAQAQQEAQGKQSLLRKPMPGEEPIGSTALEKMAQNPGMRAALARRARYIERKAVPTAKVPGRGFEPGVKG